MEDVCSHQSAERKDERPRKKRYKKRLIGHGSGWGCEKELKMLKGWGWLRVQKRRTLETCQKDEIWDLPKKKEKIRRR